MKTINHYSSLSFISFLLLMNLIFINNSQAQTTWTPVNPQDSLIIVEFQNALRAEGWPDFWDVSGPARTWSGIFWSGEAGGKVTGIQIRGTQTYFKTDTLSKSINLLAQLTQLRSLNFSELNLKVIPAEIGLLTQVNSLNLGFNNLTELPPEINSMTNLNLFNLYENDFDAIPDLSGLTNLSTLSMYGNPRLNSLNVPLLGSLETLDVSFCPITSISDDIQNLTSLKMLNLDQCSLSTLPATLDRLTNLTTLRMLRNNFEVLPEVISKLSSLELLDVSFNKLSSLPDEFQQLSNIKEIRFDHNSFTAYPESIVGLPSLLYIRGNNNQMVGEIPSDLFSNVNMSVNLSKNNLSGLISGGPVGEVPNHLNIEGNRFLLKDVETIYPSLVSNRSTLNFNPQQKIGSNRTIIPEAGDDTVVRVDNFNPMENAVIRWYKKPDKRGNEAGEFIFEGTEVLLSDFDPQTDGGVYYCIVTHPSLGNLELQSNEISVIGNNKPPSLTVNNLKFRSDSIPILVLIGLDDFTNSSELGWNVTNTANLTFSELPYTYAARREIILNDPSWVGTDTVLISIVDEQGNEASKSITIKVLDADNDPPLFTTVPTINMRLEGPPQNGTTGCPTIWTYGSSTNIGQFVSDDFDEPKDLVFSLDPNEVAGFQQNNLFISLDNFSQPKRLDALMFACQDTSFSVTFDLEVTDTEGAVSSHEITLQYDPANSPPQVQAIPEQVILKGTEAFPSLDLSNYVTDDFLSITELNWSIISQNSIDLSFDKDNNTVMLNAAPLYQDSTYSNTVNILVSESTNSSIFSTFTVTYSILEEGVNISGTISDDVDNLPIAGVEIEGFPFEVLTDASGNFIGEVPPNWSGEISPKLENYSFDPESMVFTNIQSDSANNNFTGTFNGTYKLSGLILNSSGNPLSGVILSGFSASIISDAEGRYEAEVPAGWSGEIIPQLNDYSFDPVSITLSNIQSDNASNNFTSTYSGSYTFSGNIEDSSGLGLEGVKLIGFAETTLTNAQGFYTATIPAGWSGTIEPELENFTFNPESKSFANIQSDSTNNDFTGTFNGTYKISGLVLNSSGNPLSGVTLSGFSTSIISNAEGRYEAEVPAAWSGEIVPQLNNYSFDPASIPLSNIQSDTAGNNFTATYTGSYTISGNIEDSSGLGLEGVELIGFPETTLTNSQGFYTATIPAGWSEEIVPQLNDYSFDPASIMLSNIKSDSALNNFTATYKGNYTISGNIEDASGSGLEGVELKGFPEIILTNAQGGYIATVSAGWSGTITPFLENYLFEPTLIAYENVEQNMSDQDYIVVTVTGLLKDKKASLLSVYPNPTNGPVEIKFANQAGKNRMLTIINSVGEIIEQFKIEEGKQKLSCDFSNLTGSGSYYLKMTENGKLVAVAKLMVLKE